MANGQCVLFSQLYSIAGYMEPWLLVEVYVCKCLGRVEVVLIVQFWMSKVVLLC